MAKELKVRNREIYKKWKTKKMGYKKLGVHYNLDYTTVRNIVHRERRREAGGVVINT